ncbi:MAG: M28 family peptidase [Pirellulales bacterium]|nr:M28 family peptidase [Pirellulales bacterium]
MTGLSLAVLLAGLVAATAAAKEDSALAAALESIRADQLKQHVDYLADDALEGRKPGTPGGRQAGDYLAKRFEELRLEPAGDDGSYFQAFHHGYRNVLGLVRGADPGLAVETVVVGAHYDHVGFGTWRNSRAPGGGIHNGADDNASGTSGLIELAEALAGMPKPPRRSILLAAWDGEEEGMLGSQHWIDHPTVSRNRIVLVLNMDMIGRLRENRLHVLGTRSGSGLRRLVTQCNHPGFDCTFVWTTTPSADHWPFFDAGIPFLMLHTGLHDDYHTPRDDADRIDHEGMRRVVRLALRLAYDVAQSDRRFAYRDAARHETDDQRGRLAVETPSLATRLGVQWQESPAAAEGVRLTGVVEGSAAQRAALRPGDRIVRLGRQEIHSGDDLRGAVVTAPREVELLVYRPGEDAVKRLAAELDGQPLRLGITWRIDAAEPGSVILTHVVSGSPAARAGLAPGDRIYQVAGRDFADDAEFAKRVASLPGPLELLVERGGRLRTVVVRLESPPAKQAA